VKSRDMLASLFVLLDDHRLQINGTHDLSLRAFPDMADATPRVTRQLYA
jgi:hypothetical protein